AETLAADDPFFVKWDDFLRQVEERALRRVDVSEQEGPLVRDDEETLNVQPETAVTADLSSLDAFRPIVERAPDPEVAEVQRREFFEQLHRWSRQGYGVHVFCNNDG